MERIECHIRCYAIIKNDNITLDVFSSTKIYGDQFMDSNDDAYKPLYAQAAELKNVNYRGWHSNDYICEHITDYQIFPYSNNWEETSCISAIEALGAGLHMITNYGALFETCSEWPVYVQYDTNYKNMSECFAYAIQILWLIIYITIDVKNTFKCNKSFTKSFILGIKEEWNGQTFRRSFKCKNHEPIWFNKDEKKTNNFKYSVFVGTPCHSDVSIHYTQSVLELQKNIVGTIR